MTIINGPEGPLEALFQGGGLARPDPTKQAVLLVPPHPRLIGNADAAVLGEIVWRLGLNGIPTIRFNFRGVGASAGTIRLPPLFDSVPHHQQAVVGFADLVADAKAALAHLRESWPGPLRAVGYSVGGVVADVLEDVELPPVLVSPAWHRLPRLVARSLAATVVAETDGPVLQACRAYGVDPIVIATATASYSRGLPAMARSVAIACRSDEST
jgi:uncharacterized protein